MRPRTGSAGSSIARSSTSASISLSIADSPSSGNDECAARPVATQLEPQDAARGEPEPVVGRLAVDEEPAIRAAAWFARARAVAAALFADHEQQADARLARPPQPIGGRDLRGQNPFASHAPRPYEPVALDAAREERRDAVEMRGEHDRRRSPAVRAITLNRVVVDRLFGDGEAERAQVVGQPAARLRPRGRSSNRCRRARASGDEIDGRVYRIHASSSVRVSVRESRYFTMTGVASERPHSGPLPAGDRARARHDDRAFGDDERPIGGRLDDLAAARGRRPASIRSAPCRRR